MFGVLISGKVNETDTKQVLIAYYNSQTYTYMRVTNGGRGEQNAWSSRNLNEYASIGTLTYPLIGEVLATPLTGVDVSAIVTNELPNVLIQKLTKQYRLRHTNVDTTRTMEDVVNEVVSLNEQDPSLVSKYRSDGRSVRHTTTQIQREKIVTQQIAIPHTPIVLNQIVKEDTEHTLAYVPSLTNETVRTYVPRKFANGLTEEQLYLYAIKNQKNVSVEGHAGTGKTSSLMTFSAKHNLEFGSVSCNAGVDPSQFFGRLIPNEDGKLVWQDGIVTYFFRNGGVLVIDEADFLPQKIASVLHSALDGRRTLTLLDHKGEVIKAHPNLLIVMCWNGRGYRGTSEMNKAFSDRFAIKLQFDYDTNIERKFIPSETLLDIAKSMRDDAIAGIYETPISTRLLKEFVELAQNLSYEFAVDNFVTNFKEDERASVKLLLDSRRHNLEQELTGKVND